jgi:hypothetical protein
MGRPPKLTPHQRKEAIKRRERGEESLMVDVKFPEPVELTDADLDAVSGGQGQNVGTGPGTGHPTQEAHESPTADLHENFHEAGHFG